MSNPVETATPAEPVVQERGRGSLAYEPIGGGDPAGLTAMIRILLIVLLRLMGFLMITWAAWGLLSRLLPPWRTGLGAPDWSALVGHAFFGVVDELIIGVLLIAFARTFVRLILSRR